MPDGTVLALALDTADAPLVRDLIDAGQLPVLAELEREGQWGSMPSPARLGSGATWPCFYTGRPAEHHGIHGSWVWDPDAMRPRRPEVTRLRPFWAGLGDRPVVGVLDVPMAPPAPLDRGFEVLDWGAHDPMLAGLHVSPPQLAEDLSERHPFSYDSHLRPNGADKPMDAERLVTACVKGAEERTRLAERLIEQLRPDLALIAYTELHHCAHELWHTVEPDHRVYASVATDEPRSLLEIYREVDRQLERLLATVGDSAPVLVFSPMGMRAGYGICQLLSPVLTALGYTTEARISDSSTGDRARAGLTALKRHTPPALKRAYHAVLPREVRVRVAGESMMPPIDWSATRAFSLPSADQHGDVRVNLCGREAEGIVAPEDYAALRQELIDTLWQLANRDGEALVDEVIRTSPDDSPPAVLPDLVVHWSDAALDSPVHAREPDVSAVPLVDRERGQHRAEGFFISRGLDPAPPDGIEASDLGDFLLRACRPAARTA